MWNVLAKMLIADVVTDDVLERLGIEYDSVFESATDLVIAAASNSDLLHSAFTLVFGNESDEMALLKQQLGLSQTTGEGDVQTTKSVLSIQTPLDAAFLDKYARSRDEVRVIHRACDLLNLNLSEFSEVKRAWLLEDEVLAFAMMEEQERGSRYDG
jgi:hypothetical protein